MPDKAIFLDRDDTIIEDPGYINSAEQVKLIPAVAQALIELRKLGFKLVVVSNQSGIARGIIQEQAIGQIHDRLKQLLAEHNAYLDRIYYCPYHPDGAVQKFRKDSDWRKPKPGMLLAASKEMKINLADSWMIGNGFTDIAAGKAAGCRTILIKSNIKPPVKKPDDPDPDFEAINLREAVNIVKRGLVPKQNIESVKPIATSASDVSPAPEVKKQSTEPIKPVIAEPHIEIQKERQSKTPIVQQAPEPENFETIEQNVEQPAAVNTGSRTEQLLEEIKLLLKSHQRNNLYTEFSATKLIAGIMQVLVLFCLVVSVWYKLSPTGKDNAVFTAIGFAIILQLIVLTLYVMHRDK